MDFPHKQIYQFIPLSLHQKKIPHRRLTFAKTKGNNQEQPQIQQEDTISEEDFQSAQGEIVPTDALPFQTSPVAPREEIILHTGLTDQMFPINNESVQT